MLPQMYTTNAPMWHNATNKVQCAPQCERTAQLLTSMQEHKNIVPTNDVSAQCNAINAMHCDAQVLFFDAK